MASVAGVCSCCTKKVHQYDTICADCLSLWMGNPLPIIDGNGNDVGFKGYWYVDSNGNNVHSWDYETSIGE